MHKRLLLAAIAAAFFMATPSASQAGPICDSFKKYYAAGLSPKAFAVGTGTCGYATGQKAQSLADAKWQALNYCAGYNGAKDCRVIWSQDGSPAVATPVSGTPNGRRVRAQQVR